MKKGKTIGELPEEARRKSGATKLAGYDIMDLDNIRFICRGAGVEQISYSP